MGRPKPGEIVRYYYVVGWSDGGPGYRSIESEPTRAEAVLIRSAWKSSGHIVGPIARHVTRAPWMAAQKKVKK